MKKLLILLSLLAITLTSSNSTLACKTTVTTRKSFNNPNDLKKLKDLEDLTDTLLITSEQDVNDFTEQVLIKIRNENGFADVSDTEVAILKGNDSVLKVADIKNLTIVKIKAKTDAKKVFGEKNVKINWTFKKAAKKSLVDLNITVNINSLKTVDDFTDKLLNASKENKRNLRGLTKANVDFFKSDGCTALTNPADIKTGVAFVIKAKANDSTFEEQQTITVTWTQTSLSTL